MKTEAPVTENEAGENKKQRAREFREFLLFVLAGLLLSTVLAFMVKMTGHEIHCFGPACPPPCMPPQVGDWPDCCNPGGK